MQRLSLADASKRFDEIMLETLEDLIGLDLNQSQLDTAIRKINQMHQERFRDYHDIRHPTWIMEEGISLIETHPEWPINRNAFILAAALHDAVMKLGRALGWNEEQSAELADILLTSLGAPNNFVRVVKTIILATIKHDLPSREELPDEADHNAAALLLDLDLAGLCGTPAAFEADTEANWREWQAVCLRYEFDAGRIQWAKDFLAHKADAAIYTSPFFTPDQETQARVNLAQLAGR